jgi:hypothetical protein
MFEISAPSRTRMAAGPLRGGVAALPENHRDCYHRVRAFLEEWSTDDAWRKPAEKRVKDLLDDPDTRLVEVDSFREQVVLIDGPRGAGKTTLMLTLRQELEASQDTEMIVCCPVIDLQHWDPHKHHIPSLIAERLAKLVDDPPIEALFGPPPGARGSGVDRARLSDVQARTQRSLQRALAARWGSRGSSGQGFDEWAEEGAEVHRSSLELESLFARQVDLLIHAWPIRGRRREDRDRLPFFVIFVDDVDMRPESIVHLLRAVRLVRHPRLAFVIAGDRHLMQHVCRKHAEELVGGHRFFTSQLGERLFNRSVPPTQRLVIPPLTGGIWEFRPPVQGAGEVKAQQQGAPLQDLMQDWLGKLLGFDNAAALKSGIDSLSETFSLSVLARRPRATYDLYLQLLDSKAPSQAKLVSHQPLISSLRASADESPLGPKANEWHVQFCERLELLEQRREELKVQWDDPRVASSASYLTAQALLAQLLFLIQEVQPAVDDGSWVVRPTAAEMPAKALVVDEHLFNVPVRYFSAPGRLRAKVQAEELPDSIIGGLLLLEDVLRAEARMMDVEGWRLPPERAHRLLAPCARLEVEGVEFWLPLPLKPFGGWIAAAQEVRKLEELLLNPGPKSIDLLAQACGISEDEEFALREGQGATLLSIPELRESRALTYLVTSSGTISPSDLQAGRRALLRRAWETSDKRLTVEQLGEKLDAIAGYVGRVDGDGVQARSGAPTSWMDVVGSEFTPQVIFMHSRSLGPPPLLSSELPAVPILGHLLRGRSLEAAWARAADAGVPQVRLVPRKTGRAETFDLQYLHIEVDGRAVRAVAPDQTDGLLVSLLAAEFHVGIGGEILDLKGAWPGIVSAEKQVKPGPNGSRAKELFQKFAGSWFVPSHLGLVDLCFLVTIWNEILPTLMGGGSHPLPINSETKMVERLRRLLVGWLQFQHRVAVLSKVPGGPQASVADAKTLTAGALFVGLGDACRLISSRAEPPAAEVWAGARGSAFVSWARGILDLLEPCREAFRLLGYDLPTTMRS